MREVIRVRAGSNQFAFIPDKGQLIMKYQKYYPCQLCLLEGDSLYFSECLLTAFIKYIEMY